MIENTKCDCGHQNAVGTVLCEACGKPLFDDGDTAPLEMRYDGVARRSQKINPSFMDRVWNFFSSVKIAIILILITLIGSAIGTIYPQESTLMNVDFGEYYAQTYGITGTMYYLLGFSHTFSSWWYKLLLVMIGASLVICSLDRVLPLYRALSKRQVRKHMQFLTRQKVIYQSDLSYPPAAEANDEAWVQALASVLKKRHYRVYPDGSALLAEKHRFSRWGPYINHIGLIILLLALLMRGIPGWQADQYVGIPEGETVRIPDTNLFLKNEQFTVKYYDDNKLTERDRKQGKVIAEKYETKAVLYECTANCSSEDRKLVEVKRHNILVNDPLSYKGRQFFQYDYDDTPKLLGVHVTLSDAKSGEAFGTIHLPMKNPKNQYTAGPYTLDLRGYFPDFALDEQGNPRTNSNDPNAPAFIFIVHGPGLPADGSVYLYFPRDIDKQQYQADKLNVKVEQVVHLGVNSMQDVEISNFTSYLNIRVDRAVPYIFAGAILFMIGVVMGLYWQHRRIWIRIDKGNKLTLGAHTNKNWYGLRNEIAGALKKMGIELDPKLLTNEVKKQ